MTHFDWKGQYNLAKKLSKNIDDEASIRSAISRCYYSAFCSARYYLVEVKHEEHLLDTVGAHTNVYSFLQKSDNFNEMNWGKYQKLCLKRGIVQIMIGETLIQNFFINDLSIVETLVEKAFLNMNVLNNNPSDFRIP